MIFGRKDRIEIKTPEQFRKMRMAGLVVAHTLERIASETGPGVSTSDLDRIAREELRKRNAEPSFLGYYGYPAVICTSVNDEVVHGIPGERPLQDGDIISVDFGAIVDGWHGDSAITIEVGTPVAQQSELSRVTRESMWAGLSTACAGNRIGDVGYAIESVVRTAGDYGILEEYVGHGIGTKMHMDPSVPNYGEPGRGIELRVGMAIAIEPMITLGSPAVHTLADNWTVVTNDGSRASHWEHTVAVTQDGPWVLTALDGGAEYFALHEIASPAAELS
jgi:methionyl aminopeptidase